MSGMIDFASPEVKGTIKCIMRDYFEPDGNQCIHMDDCTSYPVKCNKCKYKPNPFNRNTDYWRETGISRATSEYSEPVEFKCSNKKKEK